MGSSALIFAACGVHIKAVSFNYPLLFHLHSIIIVTYFKEIVKMYTIDGCKLTKLQPEEGGKKKRKLGCIVVYNACKMYSMHKLY